MTLKMKIKYITQILPAVMILFFIGCSENAARSYAYEPMKNITFIFNTKELKYNSDINAVFLYFKLSIENQSNEEVFFDIGKIQAKLNGELSSATYYDSLASVMPEKERLNTGKTENNLCFVFSDSLKNDDLKEFKVINYGLSRK